MEVKEVIRMIIIDGKIKTSEVSEIEESDKKWSITYKNNEKQYSYNKERIELLKEYEKLEPSFYQIFYKKKKEKNLYNITKIFKFKNSSGKEFFKIIFKNGTIKEFFGDDLYVVKNCLDDTDSENVFKYLKELSSLIDIPNEEKDGKILKKFFEEISFVREDVALFKYLKPSLLHSCSNSNEDYIPIFPFGCNNSQYNAVKIAMENQISVIQGPPGTGKTQTILNIIANILKDNKNVIVVSNNNSAIENVYEKLASEKYNLGFVVAKLGKFENKKKFIDQQKDMIYPNFSEWEITLDTQKYLIDIKQKTLEIKKVFDEQEILVLLKQELSCMIVEKEHFNNFVKELGINISNFKFSNKISSQKIISLWNEIEFIFKKSKSINFWFKLKSFFKYGIKEQNIYKNKVFKIIIILQYNFFKVKEQELNSEIKKIENYLKSKNCNLLNNLCDDSMKFLKCLLAKKYKSIKKQEFELKELTKKSGDVLEQYPVILSTTFSSRNSLNSNVVYDYLIMDEASQVDIVTGSLAISCAKNIVIVGDTKQLSNVVDASVKKDADEIFKHQNINEGYKYEKSFLHSIIEVMPNVKNTLLKEHYRCHPKIINFCNQKFYNGELMIMTKDEGEDDVITVYTSACGNHVRDHYSQRQIDIIKEEVFSKFNLNPDNTGIISPYKNQAIKLKQQIDYIDSDTVHKFQGKEKENIIITTVDDQITDFVDDPLLINVAVSRAKSKLIVIVSGNKQVKGSNIKDLIKYAQYNNFKVLKSEVNSVFDYLYKQNSKKMDNYFKKNKKISEYNSENIMYDLLKKILKNNFSNLDFKFSYPLYLLVGRQNTLNEKEKTYVENVNTHVDFLVFKKTDKSAVLAIEVDGYYFHKEGTLQSYRDSIKKSVLDKCGIKLCRFSTNGSLEEEKISAELKNILLEVQ